MREQPEDRIAVVVATRDRVRNLEETLHHLTTLPERPRVVVVDNASTDGTVAMVRQKYPGVAVVPLAHNLWGAARTVGARHVRARFVAFSDDDSWWAAGSLERAADILDAHPRLGLLAARVLVGSEERVDPTCELMARTPLSQDADLGRAAILGFIACGSVVRRHAYLGAGGFDQRFEIGGEEEVLALDLATEGWGLHYATDVVAHHHPSETRSRSDRHRRELRNVLWSTWLRYPRASVLARSVTVLREAVLHPSRTIAVGQALRELPWVLRARRPVSGEVAESLARLHGL